MTWYSHRVLTFIAVFEIFNNLAFALLSAIFSTIPDRIEGKGFIKPASDTKHLKWREKHRRLSHWWVNYVLLLIIGFFITRINKYIGYLLIAVAAGSIFHILQDAISGMVPGLSPKRKSFGIRLIRTGSIAEKVLILLIIALFIAEKIFNGGFKWKWNL